METESKEMQDSFAVMRELLEKIEHLTNSEISYKNIDIIRMIDYYTALTNAIEERRNKIYENSLVIISISVTAVTIIGMFISSWNKLLFIPLTFFAVQFLFQIILILSFYHQNSIKYVFNMDELSECSNQWKWFYRGNHLVREINTRKPSVKSAKSYIDGFNFFLDKYLTEDINTEIKSNLEQLYLLQVHNYYKNTFYLELSRIQRCGIICSIILTVITIIIA